MKPKANHKKEEPYALGTKASTIVYERGNRMYAYLNLGFVPCVI